jgi:hypothetical protein
MRIYAIINITDLDLIDFSQIEETSSNTIRKSLDESQFVVKWQEGNEPTFITDGTVIPVGIYTHSEALQLMGTDKWSQPIEEIA